MKEIVKMTNEEKLKNSFVKTFNVGVEIIKDDLKYRDIPQWDSLAHMKLIASLEDAFDVMFETEQVLDMSSYAKAREILSQGHGIEF